MPRPPDHLGMIPPPVEAGDMLSSPTTPSTWHAWPLTRGLEKDSILTYYFDVKITDTVAGDSQLKAVMEITKSKIPSAEAKLKPKNMKELYVEVCLDWMAATSFRFPDLVSLENLEKELGPILRMCMFNRFLLKLSFVRLPTNISFLDIEGTGTLEGLKGRVYSTTTSIAKHEGSTISISDCFRITEKGCYSSPTQWKFVFEIQLTKETALRIMPKTAAWDLLILDIAAVLYDKNEEIKKQAKYYQICLDSNELGTYNFGCSIDRMQIDKIMKCQNLKKMTVKIIFYPKNGPEKEEEDIQYLIENLAQMQRLFGISFGDSYEDQFKSLLKIIIPEEIPMSLSCPSYSCQESSRETWSRHTISRTFSINLSQGSPKSYTAIVVDLAKKQYPKMLALLGQQMLVGFKLSCGKVEQHIDFIEHEHLTEKHISSPGAFKPMRIFQVQFVFTNPMLTRTERLIDEVVRLRKKSPDSNGNLCPVEDSAAQQDRQNNNQPGKLKPLNGNLKSPSAPENLSVMMTSLQTKK